MDHMLVCLNKMLYPRGIETQLLSGVAAVCFDILGCNTLSLPELKKNRLCFIVKEASTFYGQFWRIDTLSH